MATIFAPPIGAPNRKSSGTPNASNMVFGIPTLSTGSTGSPDSSQTLTTGVAGFVFGGAATFSGGGSGTSGSGGATSTHGAYLGDLSVTGATYGYPIGVGFGTFRMGGNLIWSSGIQLFENLELGLDDASSEPIGLSSFAVAFGTGPADHLVSVWADGKLIVKNGGAIPTEVDGAISFRFYPGSETQKIDPLILADKGTSAPAFRGTVYIVFENMDLSQFDNQLPEITAEISYESPDAFVRPLKTSAGLTGGVLTSYTSSGTHVAWDRNFAYYLSVSTPPNNGISRVNMNPDEYLKDQEFLSTDILDQTGGESKFSVLGGAGIMFDGSIVASINDPGATNSGPLVRLDPDTLVETHRFGSGNSGTSFSPTNAPYSQIIIPFTTKASGYIVYNAVVASTTFNALGIYRLTSHGTLPGGLTYVWDSDTKMVGGLPGAKLHGVTATTSGRDSLYVLNGPSYTSGPSSGTVYLTSLGISPGTRYEADAHPLSGNGEASTRTKEFSPADLMPGETSLTTVGPMVYEPKDRSLLVFVKGAASGKKSIVKLKRMGTPEFVVDWVSEDIGFTPNDDTWERSNLGAGTFGQISGNNGFVIDTVSGDILFRNEAPDWTVSEQGQGAGSYDSKSQSFVGLASPAAGINPLVQYFFGGIGQVPTTLDVIVSQLCLSTPLEASDIDVTDIADISVPGYLVGSHVSVRKALEPLLSLYQVDAVESDGVIKFLKRGNAITRTLTEDDLGDYNKKTGSVLEEVRKQEIELPMRFNIQYSDHTSEYENSTMFAKRMLRPGPTMHANALVSFNINAALEASEAKKQAEKILYSIWIERTSFMFRWPWTQIDLDPTDIVEVTLDDGEVIRSRITDFDIGKNLEIETATVIEHEAQQEISSVSETADPGSGTDDIVSPVDTGRTGTRTFLLDMPLRTDLDSPPEGYGVPLYFYVGSYTGGKMHPVELHHITGTAYSGFWEVPTYDKSATETQSMVWGSTVNALGDPPDDNAFITDNVNTLNIRMFFGADEVVTATQAEFMSGSNKAFLVKANGDTEYIVFRDVTVEANGTLTLSGLLRGRRGTDTMAFDHTKNETFVLMAPDILTDPSYGSIAPLTLKSPPEVEKYVIVVLKYPRTYKNQSNLPDITPEYKALKPYYPSNSSAVVDGSNNIDFDWERRTRVGGEWQDITGTVSVSEDTEEYEIDIYSGPGSGATVIRTITGITDSVYEYPNADIITDFGSVPPGVSFELFQMSAQVGRGFTRRKTINFVDVDDPYWSSVSFLGSFDGVDAATTAPDDSSFGHTLTFVNGAQLDTAQKKFGLSSYLNDGVNDEVSVPDHTSFDFGAGEFTVEGWFRWNTIQDTFNGLIGQYNFSTNERQWSLQWITTGTLSFVTSPDGTATTITSGSWTPSLGVWYHLAVDRDTSGRVRVYVDGVVKANATDTTDIDDASSPDLGIGYYDNLRHMDGWIDEVRITKGVARYGGAFTPPTDAFPRPI